jgi:hypothetical protein
MRHRRMFPASTLVLAAALVAAAKLLNALAHGGLKLVFDAPSAGHLTIGWYLVPRGAHLTAAKPKPVVVASLSMTLHNAGKAKVKLTLTKAGKAMLQGGKRLRLADRASFTPADDQPTTVTKPRRCETDTSPPGRARPR